MIGLEFAIALQVAVALRTPFIQLPPPDHRFLLQFAVEERCYECPWRFANPTCPADQPDCNVPFKTADYFEWFASVEDVFAFVNAGFRHPDPPCRPDQVCPPAQQVPVPILPPRVRRRVNALPPRIVGIYEILRQVPIGVQMVRTLGVKKSEERIVFVPAPPAPLSRPRP